MGWATYLTTTFIYNRKTYNSRYEVENDLSEVRDMIQRQWETIRNLAFITEPQKFCEPDETPTMYIERELREAKETLEECLVEEYKLSCLLEEWNNCHDKETGLAIPRPANVRYDSAFLDGDFIKTVNGSIEDELFDNTEIIDDYKTEDCDVTQEQLIKLNFISNTSDKTMFDKVIEQLKQSGVSEDIINTHINKNPVFRTQTNE